MVKHIGGARRKTKHIFKKKIEERGKISIKRFLQELKVGDKVTLAAEPAVQKGMYFRRFHGMVGLVVGQQGRSYKVEIKDGNKLKVLIVSPIHLKKI